MYLIHMVVLYVDSERQSARQSEQKCENTGYEIRTREECETEHLTECETVQVGGGEHLTL